MRQWDTLKKLMLEKKFEDTALRALEPEETEGEGPQYGLFLGAVNMPPAASNESLGRYDVALFLLEGKLVFDVIRTTTRHVPSFKPLSLVNYENLGKRGRTWDIRVRVCEEQDTELALAILRDARVLWKGSAAAFFSSAEDSDHDPPKDILWEGDDDAVKILEELQAGATSQAQAGARA